MEYCCGYFDDKYYFTVNEDGKCEINWGSREYLDFRENNGMSSSKFRLLFGSNMDLCTVTSKKIKYDFGISLLDVYNRGTVFSGDYGVLTIKVSSGSMYADSISLLAMLQIYNSCVRPLDITYLQEYESLCICIPIELCYNLVLVDEDSAKCIISSIFDYDTCSIMFVSFMSVK